MSARDPVAVLRECARLLPEWSDGSHALFTLAYRAEFGHGLGDFALIDRLASLCAMPSYGEDERAAFALAREALTTAGGEVGHG